MLRNEGKLEKTKGKENMKMEKTKYKIPMNLQFFADAGGEKDPEPNSGHEPQEPNEGQKQKKTFADILKDKDYSAEYNKMLKQELDAQREKLKILYDDKVSEAEKLAKMNEQEKIQYLQKKQERALEDREKAITKRELTAEAKNTLAEKKLPVQLAELLNYTDADACKLSIETMEKAFKEAVETAVQERLKGGEPTKKAQQSTESLEKQIESLMMGR